MKEQVATGLKASEKFDIEPYFLIIYTGKLGPSLSLKRNRSTSCLDFPSGAWTMKCSIMTNSTVDDHIQGVDTMGGLGYYGRVCELNSFIAYAIFIHGHTEEVLSKSEDNDPTLEFLYGMTQHLRRKHQGAEYVNSRDHTIENPINDFYKYFEKSVDDIKNGYCFEDYYEGIVEDFVTRERKKIVSNKRYKKIVKDYEDSFAEDDW
jgi:hypothetical protein